MAYYSRSYYTADGATTDFTLGFPYLKKDHVFVYLNGTLSSSWTWVNPSTIRLQTAPANGTVVLLKRQSSPQTRLVDYVSPSSLNEADLDTDSLQGFYLAQEANDQANAGVFDDPVTGQFTATGKRITNVADPVNAQDAATKHYVDTGADSAVLAAAGSAAAAAASASSGQASATLAASKAAEAAASASGAAASQTSAAGSASASAGSASTALGYRNDASASSSSASTSASTATTKASEAAASAANAHTSEVNAQASAASAAASAGSVTPVPDQINAAADAAFVDADMLPARKASDGSLIKRSWANIKAALASVFLPLTGGSLGAVAKQSNALLGLRGVVNALEWGSANMAGYGSTIGQDGGGGRPWVAFSAEAGTALNTYRTRGLKGSLLRGDIAGGFELLTVPNANADNQAATLIASLMADGTFWAGNGIWAAGGVYDGASRVYSSNNLPPPNRNKLINPNFAINQRVKTGTVVLAAGAYGHDQWKAGASGCTYTFATANNITTITITAGSLQQVVEGVNLYSDGGLHTLSWQGTSQGKFGGMPYAPSPCTGTIFGGVNYTVEFGPGTLALPQLEVGSVATPFEQRNYSQELTLCMRYMWKTFPANVAPAVNAGIAGAFVFSQFTGGVNNQILFPSKAFVVQMAAAPTISLYNPLAANTQVRNTSKNTDWSSTAVFDSTPDAFGLAATGASGSAAGDTARIHVTAIVEL